MSSIHPHSNSTLRLFSASHLRCHPGMGEPPSDCAGRGFTVGSMNFTMHRGRVELPCGSPLGYLAYPFRLRSLASSPTIADSWHRCIAFYLRTSMRRSFMSFCLRPVFTSLMYVIRVQSPMVNRLSSYASSMA